MAVDLRNIDWGSGDAKDEIEELQNEFGDIFVNIDNIDLIKIKHHLFIWGRRGSGKTAMAWKLSSGNNKNIKLIKMDFEEAEVWIDTLLAKSGVLCNIGGFPFLKSCSDLWYTSILVEMMRKLVNSDIQGLDKSKLNRFLNNFDGDYGVFCTLSEKMDDVIKMLEVGGLVDPMPYNITKKGILVLIEKLKGSVDFIEAKKALHNILLEYPDLKIRIIVDSVDKWMIAPQFVDKSAEEFLILTSVIRGLTRALIKINKKFGDGVEIKAFLPVDFKPYIENRAGQHEAIYHHFMQWSYGELAAFIAKRIAKTKKLLTPFGYAETLDNTWDEIFPFYITNNETNVKHKAFDYLLRHSQFRPREILMCCRDLTERAREIDKPTLTQAEFRDVVHIHCNEEADQIINEFQPSVKNIHDVLRKFTDSCNVLDNNTIYTMLKRVSAPPFKDSKEIVQFLYDIGFLGIIMNESEKNATGRELPYTIYNNEAWYFNFKFFDPRRSVADAKKFVIHPIFYGKYLIKADKNVTICHKIVT